MAVDRLSGDDVRSVVARLSQDSHILDTTVAENVRSARPAATDAEVGRALAGARLGAWIDSLPRGITTRVGRFGQVLSGGRRQRPASARILPAEHRVVVLGEPTEHLDPLEEAAVLDDILESLRGRSVLLITHHLERIPDDAEVVVLAAGRPVAKERSAWPTAPAGRFDAVPSAARRLRDGTWPARPRPVSVPRSMMGHGCRHASWDAGNTAG